MKALTIQEEITALQAALAGANYNENGVSLDPLYTDPISDRLEELQELASL